MKLLSCYINSFGKLHDKNFNFDNNLTVIKEDNSFGKTTLANFILSMFYSLPDLKAKGLNNDRRRYEPWHNNAFGGSLEFEYESKKYRVERDFIKNTFRLFDITSLKKEVFNIDKKPVDAANFGDVLFDINRNSFKRSAYIPQDEVLCAEIDGALNDKLRNLINATDERHSLEKSVNILQKAADGIESKRGLGKLKQIDERILYLKNRIAECGVCLANAQIGHGNLKLLKQDLEKYDVKIKDLEERINAQNEAETLISQQERYADIKNSIKESQIRVAALAAFFKNRDIESIDINVINKKIQNYKIQEKKVKGISDKAVIERGKLLNIEQAHIARRERRRMLYAQIETLKIDRNRVLAEKIKTEKHANALGSFVGRYGGALTVLFSILTLGIFYFVVKKKKSIYNGLRLSLKECNTELSRIDGIISEINADIREIDGYTQDDGNYQTLKAVLTKEEELLQDYRNQAEKELSGYDCTVRDFTECFFEIKNNYNTIKSAMQNLEDANLKLSQFLQDKDRDKLFSKAETDGVSVQDLLAYKKETDGKRTDVIKEIAQTESLIFKNEETADALTDFESELSECEEKKAALMLELNTLRLTVEKLKEANDSLASRYLATLIGRSRELIKLYDEQKASLNLDADYKILINEMGSDRELEYFSKGIKELVSICMRIALTDVIFCGSAKKPFIILDDPFVNFDDIKLEKAKNFIRKLTKEYQIIYLTCHDSRKIAE